MMIDMDHHLRICHDSLKRNDKPKEMTDASVVT